MGIFKKIGKKAPNCLPKKQQNFWFSYRLFKIKNTKNCPK
jgi:hypothetical protein